MTPQRTAHSGLLFAALCAELLLASGCPQPPSRGDEGFISGLRAMAIKAEPPEASAGQTSTLTALIVDTMGRMVNVAWSYCEAAPPLGSNVSPDCITNDSASYIYPIGYGLSATLTMPTVDPAVLSAPDRSGGVYLPIRAKATAGSDSLIAVYSLRIGMGGAPNNNPMISGVFQVTPGAGGPVDGGGTADGGTGSSDLLTPIDPVTPLPVHSGDKITLRAQFSATSAESYKVASQPSDGGTSMPQMSTESLSVSWFATGGTLSPTMAGFMSEDNVLTLDNNLPPRGGTIDLWAVGRDNRGGTDFQHRTLSLQ